MLCTIYIEANCSVGAHACESKRRQLRIRFLVGGMNY